jgi:hypothetical protein
MVFKRSDVGAGDAAQCSGVCQPQYYQKKKKKKIKRPVVMVQTCNLSTQNIEAREFHI